MYKYSSTVIKKSAEVIIINNDSTIPAFAAAKIAEAKANGLEVNKTFERSAAKLKTHRQTIDIVEVSRVIEKNYGCDLVLKDKTVLRSTNKYEPTRDVFFGSK